MNVIVCPNLLILGNHVQVIEPVAVDETNLIWYGCALAEDAGIAPEIRAGVNALRMRTMKSFPKLVRAPHRAAGRRLAYSRQAGQPP